MIRLLDDLTARTSAGSTHLLGYLELARCDDGFADPVRQDVGAELTPNKVPELLGCHTDGQLGVSALTGEVPIRQELESSTLVRPEEPSNSVLSLRHLQVRDPGQGASVTEDFRRCRYRTA